MIGREARQPSGMRQGARWLKVFNVVVLVYCAWYGGAVYFLLSSRQSLESMFGGGGAVTPVDVSPALSFFMNGFWGGAVLVAIFAIVVKELLRIPLQVKFAVNLSAAALLTGVYVMLVGLVYI